MSKKPHKTRQRKPTNGKCEGFVNAHCSYHCPNAELESACDRWDLDPSDFGMVLMLPVGLAIVRAIFQIVKDIAQGCYLADMKDEIKKTEKELIKEPEKMNIDKDLQKYFNYKE